MEKNVKVTINKSTVLSSLGTLAHNWGAFIAYFLVNVKYFIAL
jgi:hypothetical protein|tara:strand:- start:288 stop:416 length:129 start_codon:yes stop_codon:yes gene_type:complete